MSTFNRWSNLAGLQNEASEPQQLAESKQQPDSSKQMNEAQLREMISNIAKEILSERKARKDDIEYIQSILNTLLGDDTVDVDGVLGRQTANAIAKFQRDAGLKADGMIGRKTYTAMASALDAKGFDSDFVLGELMSDVPVIGRRGLLDAPAPGKEDIKMPTMNVTVADPDRDDFIAAAIDDPNKDDFIDELEAYIETMPPDPSDAQIAAAKEDEALAKYAIGAPAPGDEPIDADVVMPGMDPKKEKGAFIRGYTFRNVYGDPVMSLPKRDWEAAGSPDLARIASANKVTKVTLY